jgi:hypothetical protein
MARRGRRSGAVNMDWKGVSRTRKLLRRFPEAQRAEIVTELESLGRAVTAYSRNSAPVRTGRLVRALSYKVFPKTLRVEIGLRGRALNRKLFYARILEYGRVAFAKKGSRKGQYIGAISPSRYDIIEGRVREFNDRLARNILPDAYRKALRSLAGLTDG